MKKKIEKNKVKTKKFNVKIDYLAPITDNESLTNDERVQAMFNYMQTDSGCDADTSNYRKTNTNSSSSSDECMSALTTPPSNTNSGRISPEASQSDSSQLREMLLQQAGSSGGRAKSSCSSTGSGRNCNVDDVSNMYKFKTDIHQRFTADLGHVFPVGEQQSQQLDRLANSSAQLPASTEKGSTMRPILIH